MSDQGISSVKESPLVQDHLDLGATLSTFYDKQLPVSYMEVGKEVWNVRNKVGIIDLSFSGALKIGGKEGPQFLQGLVTNDVRALQKGQGMRAAFLNGHGKVKAFCIIWRNGDEYLIMNDPQTHTKIYNYIFPFSYAGDFQVEDVSEDYRVLSLQGPNALLVLREICFEPVPELTEYDWVETMIAGQKLIVLRHTRTGETGYDLLVHDKALKDVWDFILLKGKFHGIAPFGMKALDVLRIEAGIPVYDQDIDESNMMLEAGLNDAVSFNKGCYTGQEAVAMATYRGHVNKKISGLIFDEEKEIARGDKIIKDEKELGFISSIIKSETLNKQIGLACIKYGFFTPGERVGVVNSNQVSEATVVELPFIKH